jgi:hypothetical protein
MLDSNFFVCNAETKMSDKLTMVSPISILLAPNVIRSIQPSVELHKNQPLGKL